MSNVVGLTGGVGMGKTTVSGFLASRGCRVVDTDVIARSLTEPGTDGYLEVVACFGERVLDERLRIDRGALANIVFSSEAKRRDLEHILHPRIRSAWKSQVSALRSVRGGAIFVVIPLLFETGADKEFDQLLCVACSRATQIQRLLARGWCLDHCVARANSQMPIDDKIRQSDVVIWTDVPLRCLEQQCLKVFEI